MMRSLKQRLLLVCEFVGNVFHYWRSGMRISVAISMARNTIPAERR